MLKDVIEKFPPPPGMEDASDHQIRLRLWRSFGGPEPVRPWEGQIANLYYGWMSLGRDMNGTTLTTEKRAWVDDELNGWAHDQGEKAAAMYLFAVLEVELAKVHKELYPPQK